MNTLIYLIIYIICGFLSYGLLLGLTVKLYPESKNFIFSIFISLFGPIGLIVTIILNLIISERLYWKIKPLTREQRWEAHHKQWPSLSRKEFDEDIWCN